MNTKHHLDRLVARCLMEMTLQNGGSEAPGMDTKRPFGSTNARVWVDILEIAKGLAYGTLEDISDSDENYAKHLWYKEVIPRINEIGEGMLVKLDAKEVKGMDTNTTHEITRWKTPEGIIIVLLSDHDDDTNPYTRYENTDVLGQSYLTEHETSVSSLVQKIVDDAVMLKVYDNRYQIIDKDDDDPSNSQLV